MVFSLRSILALVLLVCSVVLASSNDASAVVVHSNPLYPIGSFENSNDYWCLIDSPFCTPTRTSSVGSRLFGVGVVSGAGKACTGTPIGRSTILTAAHCFDPDDTSASFSIPGVLDDIYGIPVRRKNFSGNFPDANDVAILKLSSKLPEWVPIFSLSGAVGIPWGAVVTHVGYGCSGTGSVGQTPTNCFGADEPNVGLNVIDKYPSEIWACDKIFPGTPFEIEVNCQWQEWGPPLQRVWLEDYDDGSSALQVATGRAPYYAEAITSYGDSGGPVLFNLHVDQQFRGTLYGVYVKPSPDEYQVLGIVSFARYGSAGSYSDQAGYVFIDASIRSWIQGQTSDVISTSLGPVDAPEQSPTMISSDTYTDAFPQRELSRYSDTDGDLVIDAVDNCPALPNTNQTDSDKNGVGDKCETQAPIVDALFLAEFFSGQVQIFDNTGQPLGEFATASGGPDSLVLDSAGNVYVSQRGAQTVERFDSTGQSLGTFAHLDDQPIALAFDASGILYVSTVSPGSSAIVRFDPSGTPLGAFVTGLDSVTGLAFDTAGNLYAVQEAAGTVERFDPAGNHLGTFASGMSFPSRLVIDPDGYVYVTEPGADRVRRFDSAGNDIGVFASGIVDPIGIAFGYDENFDGNIYVTERANGGRIRRYSTSGADLGAFATGAFLNGFEYVGGLAISFAPPADPEGPNCPPNADQVICLPELESLAGVCIGGAFIGFLARTRRRPSSALRTER